MSLADVFGRVWDFLTGSTSAPAALSRTTAGPPADEHPLVPPPQVAQAGESSHGAFTEGLWDKAKYVPANPRRVGAPIVPRAVVVHTTDMHPGQWNGLQRNWTMGAGDGACAHFAIGRDAGQGVVQFVPINRNANHAGGNPHGWFKLPDGSLVHPNTVTVGIELHAAGLLRATGKPGEWQHPDTGLLIPTTDVVVDSRGRGWHTVTAYQLEMLKRLLDDLRGTLLDVLPPETRVVPDATYASQGVADYAAPVSSSLVGHVSLDPVNRMDPGPQVMAWLRQYAQPENA
jgi:N-acetyl-anhydromuramyl-L-alanine amidase AmpD